MFEDLFTQRLTGKNVRHDSGSDRPLRATILKGTAEPETELYVLVADLGENARRGPCIWTPVPAPAGKRYTPSGGEECIVQFDSRGLPWIMQWVPDSGSHVI